ncbi:hypothetical protein CL657_05545 [bacterium]|nr:hypothetical protein [bacterium]
MQIQIKNEASLPFILNLVKRKQYLEALDRYKDYLTQDPDKLAVILIDLYKTLYNDPDIINIRLIIAELYIKYQFYDDAYIELEEMYDIDPSFSQTYFLLSKIYAHTNDHANVCKLFELAFEAGIRDSVVLDFLPKIYLDKNDLFKAISFYELLLQDNDSQPHHNKVLAELYKRIGKYEKCVAIYKNLIAIDPQYLKDGCLLLEEILVSYPTLHIIRKDIIHFYIKCCDPDKAAEHLSFLCPSPDFPLKDSQSFFTTLLDIYPAHIPTLLLYCETLIYEKAITDVIPLLSQITAFNQDTFIETCIESIKNSNPNHFGFNLFLIDRYIAQTNYQAALTLISSFTQSSFNHDVLEDLKSYCLKIWELTSSDIRQQASYNLALILFYEGKFIDSIAYCEECGNDHLDAICLKISILLEQDNINQANKLCNTYLNRHRNSKRLNELKYQIHKLNTKLTYAQTSLSSFNPILSNLSLGNVYDAIDAIQQIDRNHYDYHTAQLLLARCFYVEHKIDQSLNIATNLISATQENAKNHYLDSLFFSAICLYRLGDFEASSNILNDIEAIDITYSFSKSFKDYLHHIPLSRHKGLAITGLINVWDKTLSYTAIQNPEEASNSTSQATISFGLNHNDKACSYMIKKNINSAQSEFNLSLQLDPNLLVSHSNMSLYHLAAGHEDAAFDSIKKAKDLNSQLDIILLNEGLIYYQQGLINDSLKCFQQALRLNPNNLHAQFNLAMIYFLNNNIELCFQYLQKLLPYGLLFIHIQQFLNYLEDDPFVINHWVSPKENYNVFYFSS